MLRRAPLDPKSTIWRLPVAGTRDILDLLSRPEWRTHIKELAVSMLFDAGSNAAASSRPSTHAQAIVEQLHGAPNDADLTRFLDGVVKDPASLPDGVLSGPLILPEGYQPSVPVRDWVSIHVTHVLAKDLGLELELILELLGAIRSKDHEAWMLVSGGRLGSTIALDRPFVGISRDQSNLVIRAQAIILYAAATRMRTALVRRWSTRPMSEAVRSDNSWQRQAHLLQTACIEPARQFEAVWKTAEGQAGEDRLTGSFLEGSTILRLAEEIERSVPLLPGRRSFDEAKRRIDEQVFPAMRKLAACTPDQLREDRLGQMDFLEGRTGVSASQTVVLLAAQLLAAPRQIDEWIYAVRARESSPVPQDPLCRRNVSFGAHVRTTQWLRVSLQTDQHAPSAGNRGRDDKAGRGLVRKAMTKFAGTRPQEALDLMRINPAWWFLR